MKLTLIIQYRNMKKISPTKLCNFGEGWGNPINPIKPHSSGQNKANESLQQKARQVK